MRKKILFNEKWTFTKEGLSERITLPHTWNALDGQDGGNDYYRGVCKYSKYFKKPLIQNGDEVWIEFGAVSNSATVYFNGKYITTHNGGYSLFRVNITPFLEENNLLEVEVNNCENDYVYPQKADFTFYGGIYRDVYLIIVPHYHFELGYYGGNGLKITPLVQDGNATVIIDAYVTDENCDIVIEILGVGAKFGKKCTFNIETVHLWNGLQDPFLYKVKAEVIKDGIVQDEIFDSFGCRNIEISKDGFFLNGRFYPLRGVSKHQDRWLVGNAVTNNMLDEDMQLILEVGANSVRLAHYQHQQYFYELCDRYGICVWAEIPYISKHMPTGNNNTLLQMQELIVQNYNHPSIITWGLSNEITVSGKSNDLIENHKCLNELCHKLDSTRPTSMACVFMLETDDELLKIPDAIGYNLYFGWYVGDFAQNGEFFDEFRKSHPNCPIGLTEYGADAKLTWQTENPQKGDYSEQYQALYHEKLLECIEEHPYLWCTYVWNMFDFGADARSEGEAEGQNRKGLVTFDRKIKKDAFYIYKASWQSKPFVHICGRRYIDRAEQVTDVKIYSNLEKVSLYVDGKLFEEQYGKRTFNFKVPISKEHIIEAKSGKIADRILVRKVNKPNTDYILKSRSITNWFDDKSEELIFKPGYYSINDSVSEIYDTEEGKRIIDNMMIENSVKHGVPISNESNAKMVKMMGATSLKDIFRQAAGSIEMAEIIKINNQLNTIKKS